MNQSLYTKVITILPKYVIINNSSHKLLVTQENLVDDFTIIDSNSRENFKWLSSKASKKIMIKILDDQADDPINEWQWSSSFKLDEIGSNNIRNASNTETNKFMYWKIERRIQNVSFVNFYNIIIFRKSFLSSYKKSKKNIHFTLLKTNQIWSIFCTPSRAGKQPSFVLWVKVGDLHGTICMGL